MPFPTDGYPLAAAVSPRLQVVDSVDSTNAHLLDDVARDPDGHPHLSVLLTRDQRAGRGRLDRSWTTPPGTALAVSVLLRVEAVVTSARGWIPLIAGIAMANAVDQQLKDHEVALKWPNDVMVDGMKISGILAEVLPTDPFVVVVGAGVNTTMSVVDLPVPTATSFAALGTEVDEDRLLADYLTGLRDRIADLAVGEGPSVALREELTDICSTLGADVSVRIPGDVVLVGRAVRIDGEGRLVLDVNGVETVVAAGDVVHVRPTGK